MTIDNSSRCRTAVRRWVTVLGDRSTSVAVGVVLGGPLTCTVLAGNLVGWALPVVKVVAFAGLTLGALTCVLAERRLRLNARALVALGAGPPPGEDEVDVVDDARVATLTTGVALQALAGGLVLVRVDAVAYPVAWTAFTLTASHAFLAVHHLWTTLGCRPTSLDARWLLGRALRPAVVTLVVLLNYSGSAG